MKKLRVIWGSPCSGKTTYCEKNLEGQDVVFDYDKIKRALVYGQDHEMLDWIKDLILKMRGAYLRGVSEDKNIDDAFFITSVVTENLRDFIEKDIGIKNVEYHLVESTLEECLDRLEGDKSRPDKEKEAEIIKEWHMINGVKEEKALAKKMGERQFREMQPLEVAQGVKRFDTDYYIEGYAALWEPYELYRDDKGPVYEEFKREAFADTDMSDIILLYDHKGKVAARTGNSTLIVEPDGKGLFTAGDLSRSAYAKETHGEVASGLITKMSWSFRPGEYHFDKKTRTVVHTKIDKIYDVSLVGIPANGGTEINARSFADGVISKVQAERLERAKLQLLIDIELELKK